MSLNLLHRLKFSIRFDVLLLVLLIQLLGTITTALRLTNATNLVPSSRPTARTIKLTRELPAYISPVDSPNGSALLYHNNIIHRILRDEENGVYRNENVRWRKINARDDQMERRTKRDTISDENLEKIIEARTMSMLQSNQPMITTTTTTNINAKLNKNCTNILNFANNRQLHENVVFNDLVAADVNRQMINSAPSDILVLNFSHNSIRQIDESVTRAFANVIHLDISHNHIETFNDAVWLINNNSGSSKLTTLNLSENRLHTFDSSKLKNLKYLDLSCNVINEPNQLQLSELSDLEYIDLSGNELSRLHQTLFESLTKLKVINLANNALDEIFKNYFIDSLNMDTLILSNNNISAIENDTFVYLPNLQYLDLSNNRLDAMSIKALQGIPDLVGLSVAYNTELGNALQGFVASWSLKELDASGTGLCQIPTALAQSVHTLNISDNHFPIIRCGDLDSYPLLQHLDVSACQIIDVEDDALGRLEILVSLHLNDNNLTRIPTSLPTNLVNLYLQNNKITDIQPTTFTQLINLEVINLSGNQLMYLPGLPLPRLTSLNLRASGLKGLSQSVVKMSPNLKDLFLDENPIKCSEMLSIAEWATPCRTEKLFEFIADTNSDIHRYDQIAAMTTTSIDFHLHKKPCACNKHCQQSSNKSTALNKSQCGREHLISSHRSVTNNKKFVPNKKQPLENDWNFVENAKTIKPTNHFQFNQTVMWANSTKAAEAGTGTTTSIDEISNEQKMNRPNDTGTQISNINHTNVSDAIDIVGTQNHKMKIVSHDNGNVRNVDPQKHNPFVKQSDSVAKIVNSVPANETMQSTARVNGTAIVQVELRGPPQNIATDFKRKTTESVPILQQQRFITRNVNSSTGSDAITSHSKITKDLKAFDGNGDDLHKNATHYADNKNSEKTKMILSSSTANELNRTPTANSGTSLSSLSTSSDDAWIYKLTAPFSTPSMASVNKAVPIESSTAPTNILTTSTEFAFKLNTKKNETAPRAQSTAYTNNAKSAVIKNEKNKKLEQSNRRRQKLTSSKIIDSNKAVTSLNIDSGVDSYQRDEDSTAPATTAMSIYEDTHNQLSNNQQSENQLRQLQHEASPPPPTPHSHQQQPQQKDDDTDRKRYKLEKVNVSHDDKLDNLDVNSSVASTATATQTETEQATTQAAQTMTEHKDNNRLIPAMTKVAFSNATVKRDGIDDDVTLVNKYEKANGQTNGQHQHQQQHEQQWQKQYSNDINSNHKKTNSTTNWNTNKAISKVNGTKTDQETKNLLPSLWSIAANGTKTEQIENVNKTNPNEPVKRTRAQATTIGDQHSTNKKLQTEKNEAQAINAPDKTSNENSSSVFHKILPSDQYSNASSMHTNKEIHTLDMEQQKQQNNASHEANSNNSFDYKSFAAAMTSNKNESSIRKNPKPIANLNVSQREAMKANNTESILKMETMASNPVEQSPFVPTATLPLATLALNGSHIQNNSNATRTTITTKTLQRTTNNNRRKLNGRKNMKIKINSSNVGTDNDDNNGPINTAAAATAASPSPSPPTSLTQRTASTSQTPPIECNGNKRDDDNNDGKKCENNNFTINAEKINSVNKPNRNEKDTAVHDDVTGDVNDKHRTNGQQTYLTPNESKLIESIAVGAAESHHSNVNIPRQSAQLTMENLINAEEVATTKTTKTEMEIAQLLVEHQKPLVNGFSHNASGTDNDNQSQTHTANVNINHAKHEAKHNFEDAKVKLRLSNATKVNNNKNSNFNRQQSQQQQQQQANESDVSSGNRTNDQQYISNTSASSGLPEQWNDIRTTSGHPGLFIVIGITIGVFVSLGLIHMYRCRKPCHSQQHQQQQRRRRRNIHSMGYNDDDENLEQYALAHRNLLPMEVLNSSIRSTDAPIDLW